LRPALNPEAICTATYYDAEITYPERLRLELVQDAEAACGGARALNYVRSQNAAGGTVVLRDEVSGKSCEVRPRIVVNATGPWIDFTNRGLGRESRFIGGTKGSHVVLDHPELVKATGDEMIYFVNWDGRICIFYAVDGKIIAGATDIPAGNPDAVCDEAEVDYILEAMRMAFPSIRVDRSHVVFRFCGVRPLPRSDAPTPGQISRDHSYPVLAPGNGIDFPIYSLVGGKWTTFRALAEQVSSEILGVLGRKRIRDSADVPIGGGKGYPRMPEGNGLPPERLATLLDRYGTGADRVAAFLQAGPDAPLAGHAGYSRREIEFMARNERVIHLDDLILRRTLRLPATSHRGLTPPMRAECDEADIRPGRRHRGFRKRPAGRLSRNWFRHRCRGGVVPRYPSSSRLYRAAKSGAMETTPRPVTKSTNMSTRSRVTRAPPPANSLHTRTPHRAPTMVEPCPMA
jgi:glycerol-3-phosphate dehydrogenase